MVDSDPISDGVDTFIDALFAAFENIVDIFIGTVSDFAGNFISGDLTSNAPALLCLTLVLLGSGGVLAYKISRG